MRNRVGRAARDVLCATTTLAVVVGFSAIAHADTPVAAGISIFATVDVGFAYQSEGVPLNGASVGWKRHSTRCRAN